ncbi:YtxH domain-containing protein [Planococcus sp. ISL-109]|uniref:YtxH domain-containing protein n=1 Tax=Planococcus sp. ISL-109 TaxID=2819166 RepID=UPI001BE761A5|nr:YtxH domain-containing protein [Planococcus sp. ISL-109]MBT2584076.1 YtxH domain-containing protein [Planococcus sp. ISL-109]
MSQNKLMTGLLVGAAVGVIVSLLDRNTREDVMHKSQKATESAKYYAHHTDELKSAFKEQAERAQNLYARISEDASYVGSKVQQVKQLVPEVKEVAKDAKTAVVETKEAVVDSKDDVLSAVKEDDPSPSSSLTDDSSSQSDIQNRN